MIKNLRGILLYISVLFYVLSNTTYANENNQKKVVPELQVRFPIVDKAKILSEEQKETIFNIFSDHECYSFIQISLLVINSPSEVLGEKFLSDFSGNSKQRVVIRLITSTKEAELFWTESLNGNLQKISKNYRSLFEPFLSDGKFYEAALYGSLKVIKTLSPDYKLP